MKKLYLISPLALILCFMVGCQDKEAMAELEAMKAQTEIEKQNMELVKRYIEEMNKGNTEIFNEVFAPEYNGYYPSNSPKPMSRERRIAGLKMAFKVGPDTNYGIEELFAVRDRVIVRFVVTGTHEGDIPGIPTTGNRFEFGSIVIVRIEEGKIIEERMEFDSMGFMQQLGMELKPKEGDEK